MSGAIQVVKSRDLKAPKFRLREVLGNMEELKESVRRYGVLEPLVVRPSGDKLEVVCGQRRHLVSVELDIEVPVMVKEIDDETAFLLALTENLARKDLDPLEEARAYKSYIIGNGWGSTTDLAKKIHRSPSHISQMMSLLEQEAVLPYIESKKATVSEALEVVGLPAEKAKELMELSVKAGLEVPEIRAARMFVKAGMEPDQAVNRILTLGADIKLPPKDVKHFDPVQVALEDIESQLRLCLKSVSDNLDKYVPDGEMKADYIKEIRYPLHELVNGSIKLGKKYKKKHE